MPLPPYYAPMSMEFQIELSMSIKSRSVDVKDGTGLVEG